MRSHFLAAGVGLAIALVAILGLLVASRFVSRDSGTPPDSDLAVDFRDPDAAGGAFVWRQGKEKLSARWSGDFALSPDGAALSRMKGELTVDWTRPGDARTLRIVGDGAPTIDDFTRTPAAAGSEREAAIAETIRRFARVSAHDAATRIPALLAGGGAAAVLEEIAASPSGPARAQILTAWGDAGGLRDRDLIAVAEGAGDLESDYERRLVLTTVIGETSADASLSPALAEALLASIATLTSDYEKAQALAVLSERRMPEASRPALVAVVAGIDSAYERGRAIEALVGGRSGEDPPLTAELKRRR